MSNEIKKTKGRPKKEKDYNSPFAERLRTLAGDRTNQEIADGIGVARQTVGQFMLGNTKPDIETLCKLADYFGVSTDYLLCRTDVATTSTDIQMICEYTGLSEKAVQSLKWLYSKSEYRAYSDVLSLFIEDDNLEYLIGLLEGYITSASDTEKTSLDTMSVISYSKKDIIQLAINNTIKLILDRMTIIYLCNYETTELRLLKNTYEKVSDSIKPEILTEIEELASKYKSIIDQNK